MLGLSVSRRPAGRGGARALRVRMVAIDVFDARHRLRVGAFVECRVAADALGALLIAVLVEVASSKPRVHALRFGAVLFPRTAGEQDREQDDDEHAHGATIYKARMIEVSKARALVIGLGGLGCPVAWALAEAGIGGLTLVDFDRVELHNLHRQPLHRTADVGALKVESAAEKLRATFPSLTVAALARRFDPATAQDAVAGHDVIIDGTDRIRTKLALSDVAVRTGIPLVFGGVLRFEGQAMLVRPEGPCLRCLFEDVPDDAVPSCAQAGVLGSMPAIVGAFQACMALRALRREWSGAVEALTLFDGERLETRTLKVARRADCVCARPDLVAPGELPAEECA